MSRTDVHTPYWVKTRSPAWREFFAEDHDHTTGDCDLAIYLAGRVTGSQTYCTMEFIACDGWVRCGCRLCTGQAGRKRARRRERTELRAQIRTVLKTPHGDVDTVDVAPPGPVREW